MNLMIRVHAACWRKTQEYLEGSEPLGVPTKMHIKLKWHLHQSNRAAALSIMCTDVKYTPHPRNSVRGDSSRIEMELSRPSIRSMVPVHRLPNTSSANTSPGEQPGWNSKWRSQCREVCACQTEPRSILIWLPVVANKDKKTPHCTGGRDVCVSTCVGSRKNRYQKRKLERWITPLLPIIVNVKSMFALPSWQACHRQNIQQVTNYLLSMIWVTSMCTKYSLSKAFQVNICHLLSLSFPSISLLWEAQSLVVMP